MKHFRVQHRNVVEYRDTPYTVMRLVEQYLDQGMDKILIEQVEKKELPPSVSSTSPSSDSPDSGPESVLVPAASATMEPSSSPPVETSLPEPSSR